VSAIYNISYQIQGIVSFNYPTLFNHTLIKLLARSARGKV